MGIVCCSYRYKFEQHHIVTVITEGTWAKPFLSLATQPEVRPLLKYLICFDATKFVLLSVSTAIETVCPKIRAKALPRNSTILFPVDLWRSKTFLLKLAIIATLPLHSKFLGYVQTGATTPNNVGSCKPTMWCPFARGEKFDRFQTSRNNT